MKNSVAIILAAWATGAFAAVPAYGKCGGARYTGETTCVPGYICVYTNEWYSQCVPGAAPTTTTTKTTSSATISTVKATTTSATGGGGSGGGGGAGLDPNCAPGGNFDMSFWNLQLPTGTDGKIDSIGSASLQGCNGYTDSNFFTDKSNSEIVLLAPGNPSLTGCATTSGSKHCRTELREVDSKTGENAAWSPKGKNTLTVSMTVDKADDGSHGTAIGQVFASAASKPLAEMYYSQSGNIVVGVKPNASAGQIITTVGNVPVGTQFQYTLSYSADVLTVAINGKVTTLSTYEWKSPECYFKSGNYNQGKSAASSKVRISAIKVVHS